MEAPYASNPASRFTFTELVTVTSCTVVWPSVCVGVRDVSCPVAVVMHLHSMGQQVGRARRSREQCWSGVLTPAKIFPWHLSLFGVLACVRVPSVSGKFACTVASHQAAVCSYFPWRLPQDFLYHVPTLQIEVRAVVLAVVMEALHRSTKC